MPLLGNASLLKAGVVAGAYGTLTNDYETRVIASGGTLSTAAKNVVEAFFYSQYNNGAGGTGRVADFSSSFALLWAPVSNFAGVIVPLLGADLTNSGFVSGDWDVQTGLLGATNKFLNTGVAGNSLPQNSLALFHWVSGLANNISTIGARNAGSTACLDLGGGGATTFRGRINRSNSTFLTRTTDAANGFGLGRRASSTTYEVWSVSSGVLGSASVSTASVLGPTETLYISALNAGGTAGAFAAGIRMEAAGAMNAAPTDAQINILYNALAALDTARATL